MGIHCDRCRIGWYHLGKQSWVDEVFRHLNYVGHGFNTVSKIGKHIWIK